MKLTLLKCAWLLLFAPVMAFDTSPAIAQTAGCGSGASNSLLRVLDPIGSNQFRVACNEHDACYDTPGNRKDQCDTAWHNRMLSICARDHNTIVGRPLRGVCNERADTYYETVKAYGDEAYINAQEEPVKQLYIQVLGRQADQSGLNDHLKLLISGEQTWEQVRAGIASSQESRNNINNLYRQYLNRDADPAGMEHHVNLLASGQMTLGQIREGIKNGAEARNLRGE
jgi:hypothetical protein